MIRLLICLPLLTAAFTRPLFRINGEMDAVIACMLGLSGLFDDLWTSISPNAPSATATIKSALKPYMGGLEKLNLDNTLVSILIGIACIFVFILSGEPEFLAVAGMALAFSMIAAYKVEDNRGRVLPGPGLVLLMLSATAPFLPDLAIYIFKLHKGYVPAVFQTYIVAPLSPLPKDCFRPIGFDIYYRVACY